MTEELHKKYRPGTFKDFVGNKASVSAIQTILKKDVNKIPHAWLFTGSTGCGKTTLQRILRNKLGCEDINYFEINSSNDTGVAFIRQIQSQAMMGTLSGGIKVYAFDECHRMSSAGQDAMLKILEDSPEGVYFFFGTTNPEKMIPALKGRCTTIKVEPLNSKVITKLVKSVLAKETTDEFPADVIKEIVDASSGRPRDALKILDFVIEMDDYDEMIECIKNNTATVDDSEAIELCRVLLNNESSSWATVSTMLKTIQGEAENIRRHILNYNNKVLLNGTNDMAFELIRHFGDNYYDSGMAGLTADCYEVFRKMSK